MDYHDDILSYLNKKGVSLIFLFRRNTLRRLISVLANNYDRDAKQLNGTHKSHVHSEEEVSSIYNSNKFTAIKLCSVPSHFSIWVSITLGPFCKYGYVQYRNEPCVLSYK
jgi:hypothetical protein